MHCLCHCGSVLKDIPCQRKRKQQLSICLTLHLSRSSRMWHQLHEVQSFCITGSSYSSPRVSKPDSLPILFLPEGLCTLNLTDFAQGSKARWWKSHRTQLRCRSLGLPSLQNLLTHKRDERAKPTLSRDSLTHFSFAGPQSQGRHSNKT